MHCGTLHGQNFFSIVIVWVNYQPSIKAQKQKEEGESFEVAGKKRTRDCSFILKQQKIQVNPFQRRQKEICYSRF
jgi:hypothetical protein